MKTCKAGIILALGMLASATTAAGRSPSAFHPVGPVDLYTGHLAHLDLHLGVGDDVTAIVPQAGFQYGFGDLAAGLELGLAYADVDFNAMDSEMWPGNIALFFKGKHCLKGSWKTCLGGEFSLGIGLADLDTDSLTDLDETLGESFSLGAGGIIDLRGRMFGNGTETVSGVDYLVGVESLVFEPILTVATTNGVFLAQVYLGAAIYAPLDDLEILGTEIDTDSAAALSYGASLGGVVADLFGGTIGFRGFSTLTLEDDQSFFSLDFTLRLLLGGISPVLRFGIPLDDDSRDVFDVVISFGVAAEI